MIATRRILMITLPVLLAGCATGDPARTERTVFNNPYAAPVVGKAGVGPQCDVARGRDATCLGVPLTRKGRGTVIGNSVSNDLTRSQRRILRERAEQLRQASAQIGNPPAPAPLEPKPAVGADETP